MSRMFSRILISSKLIIKSEKYRRKSVAICNLFFSTKPTQDTEKRFANTFKPFQEEINIRKNEAKRSIVVQVQSAQSYKELAAYCSNYGNVKKMFHYTVGIEPMHFIIVEFTKESDVTNILSSSDYLNDQSILPVSSQFLWFRSSTKKSKKLKSVKNAELSVENGNRIVSNLEIKNELRECSNISDQIIRLYNITKLDDVGTRQRFLTARQVELSLLGIFPHAKAEPFGSSVNTFGKNGCDLDIVLMLTNIKKEESRLVFHCKSTLGTDRMTSARNMETIGDLIHLFLPGCARVRKILQARVPIIKYYQQFTDVECDLSISNMSGVHMSDFLYIMNSLDPRVGPLVFAVRKWAAEVGLTNSSPGRWITNFSLTLLVLFFLQKPINSPSILPSLNTLVKSAESSDVHITEDGINCTFLRNANKLHHRSQNSETVGNLLIEFFEYYSQFDFALKSVSLNEALPLTKPDHSALYIINPLERGLNVSKNVSFEELERFKIEVKNAAWALQSNEIRNDNWGLLSILENRRRNKVPLNFGLSSKDRIVEVKSLFEDNENGDLIKGNVKSNKIKNRGEKIENETNS